MIQKSLSDQMARFMKGPLQSIRKRLSEQVAQAHELDQDSSELHGLFVVHPPSEVPELWRPPMVE